MTCLALLLVFLIPALSAAEDEYLTWSASHAKAVALANRVSGQVGKSLDFRVTATDRSYNFKLRATWTSPAVIRALARLEQLSKALNVSETRALVADAGKSGDIIIQVEIDPREGSGIIPSDWVALLGPSSKPPKESRVVRGLSVPRLRDSPALAPVPPRNYSYEIFWLMFPARVDNGEPLFYPSDREAELSIRIQGKVGKVRWLIPEYFLIPK